MQNGEKNLLLMPDPNTLSYRIPSYIISLTDIEVQYQTTTDWPLNIFNSHICLKMFFISKLNNLITANEKREWWAKTMIQSGNSYYLLVIYSNLVSLQHQHTVCECSRAVRHRVSSSWPGDNLTTCPAAVSCWRSCVHQRCFVASDDNLSFHIASQHISHIFMFICAHLL